MLGPRLSHYEILAKVGGGGMGVVYKARDTHLDRFVAIKTLSADTLTDPERRGRFSREAKAASALNHPGIITIHDIATEDGIDFIAMEYVQGKTLDQLIGRKGLSLKDTLNYAIQAAEALTKAHEAGIVHRDLKPSNIMVTEGRVKILDFGVAKLAWLEPGEVEIDAVTVTSTASIDSSRLTGAGKIVGTAAYMSPEQAAGLKVDARSDIFSFGAVLYEMVTGVKAFKGDTSVSTLAAVLNLDPKPPGQLNKDVPHNLERIILRCLRKDPARRIQFMADLVVELEEIKTESGTQIDAQLPARRRAQWRAASVPAVALLAAGVWYWWPSSPPLPQPAVTLLTSYPGDESSPTFSPDGNQVAFTWNGAKRDNTDIYIAMPGSQVPLRLTTNPARDWAPAWSPDPDPTQIAFVREQGDHAAIYLTPPVPESERKLVDVQPAGSADRTTLSWFPDGKHLAVAEREPGGQSSGIFVIPVDSGSKVRVLSNPITAGAHYFPAVSPDGKAVAYGLCPAAYSCDVYYSVHRPRLRGEGAAEPAHRAGHLHQRDCLGGRRQIRHLRLLPGGRELVAGVDRLRFEAPAAGAGLQGDRVSRSFACRQQAGLPGGGPRREHLEDHARRPTIWPAGKHPFIDSSGLRRAPVRRRKADRIRLRPLRQGERNLRFERGWDQLQPGDSGDGQVPGLTAVVATRHAKPDCL